VDIPLLELQVLALCALKQPGFVVEFLGKVSHLLIVLGLHRLHFFLERFYLVLLVAATG
jgi:hypothetical protein